jgi:hypothetical protein
MQLLFAESQSCSSHLCILYVYDCRMCFKFWQATKFGRGSKLTYKSTINGTVP